MPASTRALASIFSPFILFFFLYLPIQNDTPNKTQCQLWVAIHNIVGTYIDQLDLLNENEIFGKWKAQRDDKKRVNNFSFLSLSLSLSFFSIFVC